jgi:hypothetical protein
MAVKSPYSGLPNGIHPTPAGHRQGSFLPPRTARHRQNLVVCSTVSRCFAHRSPRPRGSATIFRRARILINSVEASTKVRHIVIDEVQKLPTLLEIVHLLIERKAGSSSFSSAQAHESYAVRESIWRRHLYPLGTRAGKI